MDQAILNTPGDAVRHIFHKAVSLLAQLVHFAYAQDAETGRYADPRLAAFGDKNVHRELRQQHRETFAAWLVLSLEQQHNEMKEYFSAHSDAQPLLHCWIHERLYQRLIPPDASAAEKQLFSIDFEIVAVLTYRDLQEGPASATLFERSRLLPMWRTSAAWGS